LTVSQKVSVSLLISVVLFAGFAALAFTGLFEFVETRFYNPAVAKGLEREIEADAQSTGEFLDELRDRFGAGLKEASVKRSFLPNQSAEDIFERTKIFGSLMESIPGLQSVRFVDSAGKRLHFSTSRADVLKQDRLSVAYRNYGDAATDRPFETLSIQAQDSYRFVVDAANERFLFVFPFTDSFDVYKGIAIYSVSVRSLVERLITDGRLKVGEDLVAVEPGVPDPALAKQNLTPASMNPTVPATTSTASTTSAVVPATVSDTAVVGGSQTGGSSSSASVGASGVVSGLPRVGRLTLSTSISGLWNEGARGPVPLATSAEGSSYALVSTRVKKDSM